jgi:hypothetical protein
LHFISFSSISLGDGSSIPIHYVGQAQIHSPLKPLHFRDVLVAPSLTENLIFVCHFTRDNLVSIEFDPFGPRTRSHASSIAKWP